MIEYFALLRKAGIELDVIRYNVTLSRVFTVFHVSCLNLSTIRPHKCCMINEN